MKIPFLDVVLYRAGREILVVDVLQLGRSNRHVGAAGVDLMFKERNLLLVGTDYCINYALSDLQATIFQSKSNFLARSLRCWVTLLLKHYSCGTNVCHPGVPHVTGETGPLHYLHAVELVLVLRHAQAWDDLHENKSSSRELVVRFITLEGLYSPAAALAEGHGSRKRSLSSFVFVCDAWQYLGKVRNLFLLG